MEKHFQNQVTTLQPLNKMRFNGLIIKTKKVVGKHK